MSERVLYFDCFSGIAGDMTLGALIDLGLDVNELKSALESLPIDGWTLDASVGRQMGLRGVDVQIRVNGEVEGPAVPGDSDEVGPDHGHGHHGVIHEDEHHDPESHSHQGHRHYAEIAEIIRGGDLPAAVVDRALSAFEVIAKAEARVHGVSIEDVHFHEVGAVDSIIDICGVAWGLNALGVDRVESAPLPMGRGFIRCAHGRVPLPAPATLEILRDIEIVDSGLDRELVTPTGAAFIKAWGTRVGPMPNLKIESVGWGMGDARFPDRPNMLRLVMGVRASASPSCEVVETNVDDMSPEVAGYLLERLFDAGALDAWFVPVQMKKNRPGVTVSALVESNRRRTIEDVLLTESSAIGVRHYAVDRTTLEREQVWTETPWGPVPLKAASREGQIVNIAPEYEACAEIARATGVPLKTIFQYAIAGYYDLNEADDGPL